MRNTLLILFFGVIQLYAVNTYSQNTKLSIDLNNVKLSNVLEEIESSSEFYFLYNAKLIDVNREVSILAEDNTIYDILKSLFYDTGVNFKVFDRQIILTTSEITKLSDIPQQQLTVSGKVTDASTGEALPGVNIVVKGTSIGTISNIQGQYSLSVSDRNSILVFSFLGYSALEISLNGRTNLDIALKGELLGLDEVVVVGYGTQKKVNLTGAVAQVKVDEILKSRPITNIANALQGSIPGLQITSSSGRPGELTSLNLRGITSINGGNPLILVDNVPMNIEDVNPNDIESISVLKDASSSSIYGGRAAFGIVLINTKKGVRNQPIKFNYSNNFIINQATDLPEKASTMERVLAWKAGNNTTATYGEDLTVWENLLAEYQANPAKYLEGETYVDGVLYRLREEDLYKLCMTNGFEQMHNLTFSGGSEKSDYRFSVGYSNEDGIMITNKDSYKKYNFNVYLNTDLTKKLISSSNVMYNNNLRLTPNSYVRLFSVMVATPSYVNPGQHTLPDGTTLPSSTPNNIIKIEPADRNLGENLRFFEKLEYNLAKDFKLIGEYTFLKSISNITEIMTDNKYWDPLAGTPTFITSYWLSPRSTSSYTRANSNTDYHAVNIYANFIKDYRNHKFNFLVGTNHELSKYSYFSADRTALLSASTPSLSTSTGTMTTDESFSDYAISGYFSRLNYSYKNKYLFEANARYDGSSKFPKSGRYGFFPSFSLGWIVSEENFMKSVEDIINVMKIRGSWGKIGNQSISNYAYIPGMGSHNSSWINPANKILYLTLYTPDLVSSSFTWETVRTSDIGIDMSVLNKRLNITLDYYNRATLNMLGPASELPAVIGASAPKKNVANLESKGWELSLDWRMIHKDYGYSLGINVSDSRSFVTKFKNEGGLLSQYYEGYEFGEIWGYETYGYYTDDDFVTGSLDANLMNGIIKEDIPVFHTIINPNPGDIRYVDLNDDGTIDPGNSTLSDPGDRRIIGNSNRRYQFGVAANCFYKSFDFSLFFQGVGKRDVWIDNMLYFPLIGTIADIFKHQLDYWTPESTNAFYPRYYNGGGGNTPTSRMCQTKYLLNGAYIMLKNIELGYSLPKLGTEKLSINQLRLFLSAENLIKFDYLPAGIDTEAENIHNGGIYPFLRKISFGVNASF